MWAFLVEIGVAGKEIVANEATHQGIKLPLKGPQGNFLTFLLADKGMANNLVYWLASQNFFSSSIGSHIGKFCGNGARAKG